MVELTEAALESLVADFLKSLRARTIRTMLMFMYLVSTAKSSQTVPLPIILHIFSDILLVVLDYL